MFSAKPGEDSSYPGYRISTISFTTLVPTSKMDMDMDIDMATAMASMAAQLGMDQGTANNFYEFMLQQLLQGEGNGNDDEHVLDSDLDDDAKVVTRVDSRFTIPKHFSTEKLQENCSYCDNGGKHARNLCCGSHRGEKHSGVLEFMSWDFDPLLAARTRRTKVKPAAMEAADASGVADGGENDGFADGDDENKSVHGSDDGDDCDEKMTWGGILESEVSWAKENLVDKKWNFDYRKVFSSWDNAFRWTCCGVSYSCGLFGCDNHGARGYCSCDYCRGRQKYIPRATQANRFLKFNGIYGFTDWDVVRGVPWTKEMHKHFPREFREAVKTLLLCHASAAAGGFSKIPAACMLEIVSYLRE